jgi:glycosyltransferase involved in cell wall biosynthesis
MSETDVTVSVVIPTYNRSQLIERAVNSVRSQSYRDLEVIVVDDASTDDTRDRVEAIQRVDSRVRYVRHETNRGAQAARNTGIEAAHGKFNAFLDSDNEWLPNKLSLQIPKFTGGAKALGVVYCGFWRVSAAGERLHKYEPQYRGAIYQFALQQWITDTSTLVVRKEILKSIRGFDESINAYQEWDFCIRLARVSEFDFVPECLSLYHEHDLASISKDHLRDASGYLRVVDLNKAEILHNCGRRAISMHYLRSARLFILAERLDSARAMLWKSVQFYPLNTMAILHLGASLLGGRAYDSLRSGKQQAATLFHFLRMRGLKS